MLSNNLAQRWMLSIWDIIEKRYASRSTKHAKNSVDLAGKNSTLGKLLPSQSGLIDFHRPRKFDVGQHLGLDKKAAGFPNELKVFDDLVPISNYILGKSGPHVIDPKIYRDIEQFYIQIAKWSIHGDTFTDSASSALPYQLRS